MDRVRACVGGILVLVVLAGGFGAISPGTARGGTAAVRGTVAAVRPGCLYLRDAREGDREGAPRDVLVQVDGGTAYYNGTRRAAADDVVPGLIVLARCVREGKTLRATVVRIVGGTPR